MRLPAGPEGPTGPGGPVGPGGPAGPGGPGFPVEERTITSRRSKSSAICSDIWS
ncbi:MAG: hypothetical protein ACRYE7_00155 [Janthinobacterium lividum]